LYGDPFTKLSDKRRFYRRLEAKHTEISPEYDHGRGPGTEASGTQALLQSILRSMTEVDLVVDSHVNDTYRHV
jgi:hypothetical protein